MTDIASNPHRHPSSVVPSHYRIKLEPNLEKATFIGSVEIEVEVNNPTHTIQMNAADLAIQSARVVDSVGSNTEVADIFLDAEMERLTLSFDSQISPGPHTIVAEFTGVLNDKLNGFYRS